MTIQSMSFPPMSFPQPINSRLPSNDFLYHLGFDRNGLQLTGEFSGKNLEEVFGDVTHVCMGGSAPRAQRFADTLNTEMNPDSTINPVEAIGKTERFSLYKVGKVISVSHGMGMPSMSILLHEITKMLYYAKGCDEQRLRNEVRFIRIGTSGGIEVEGGTVVITENARNAKGEKRYTETRLGQDIDFPTELNLGLSEEIQAANIEEEIGKKVIVVLGDTVGTDCFYEGQGRLDGFFEPGYTAENKLDWLKKLYGEGVRNFEMEAPYFASFCLRAGIPAAIVCVALLNRLEGDQVTKNLDEISQNAELIVLNYLKRVKAII